MKKVVFMGDSITAQFKKLDRYPHVTNMGIGGYKTTDLMPLVKDLRLHRPDIVFLMIGINDFLCNKRYFDHGYTIPFKKTYDALVDMITTNLPKAHLYLVSILPMHGRDDGMLIEDNVLKFNLEIDHINQFITEIAKTYHASYIDLCKGFKDQGLLNKTYSTDGIHLTDAGYAYYLDVLRSLEPTVFEI